MERFINTKKEVKANMDIRDLAIDSYATVGTSLILTDVRPAFVYKGGKRTDEIEGYRYTVAMPERGFDKISVKIPGRKLFDRPEKDPPIVLLDGLKLSASWTPDGYKVVATATGIRKK